MSGVVALLGYDSDRSNELTRKMCQALKHRGPDDSGWFADSEVGLGNVASFRGSSKIAHQPLCNKKKDFWITFDGELHNASELREQLGEDRFSTTSDAEVVLHAYEEYGRDCPARLDGNFAFCIWDSSRKELFCARDRFGIKPLYYFTSGDRCVFASEIKAIFVDSTIPRVPNHDLICKYVLTGYHYRNGETFFAQVMEVLPGYYVALDAKENRIQAHEYWHLPVASVSKKANDDYAPIFLSMLRHAIQRMLPVDVRFATCVSGGLDSQAIASIIGELKAEYHADKYSLISAVCRRTSRKDDEEPYVREFEQFRRIAIKYVYLPDSLGWREVKDFVYYLEEPFGLLNAYLPLFLAQELKTHGVRVAFFGTAGDFFLWGLEYERNRYLKDLWQRKNIRTLLIELAGMAVKRDFSSNPLGFIEVTRSLLMPARTIFVESQFLDQKYLDQNFARAKESLVDQTIGDLVAQLETCDRLFSAFSVEPRHPFLDMKFADFMNSLPSNQRIRRGVKKYILRKALKGIIPEVVRKSNRKFATAIPLVEWLIDLRPEIIKLLSSDTFKERRMFNQARILQAYNALCRHKLNSTQTVKFANFLWRVVELELWFEIYIDPHSFSRGPDFSTTVK